MIVTIQQLNDFDAERYVKVVLKRLTRVGIHPETLLFFEVKSLIRMQLLIFDVPCKKRV